MLSSFLLLSLARATEPPATEDPTCTCAAGPQHCSADGESPPEVVVICGRPYAHPSPVTRTRGARTTLVVPTARVERSVGAVVWPSAVVLDDLVAVEVASWQLAESGAVGLDGAGAPVVRWVQTRPESYRCAFEVTDGRLDLVVREVWSDRGRRCARTADGRLVVRGRVERVAGRVDG
jgi:hypothetical protein